jgi:repressor LexA
MVPTKKQRQVLEALTFLNQKGENPTVREVASLLGLSSPATVHKHLHTLEKEGLIKLSGKSRGIKLHGTTPPVHQADHSQAGIPLVGRIAAGLPIENPGSWGEVEELAMDPRLFFPGAVPGEIVALRVIGESMVEAGILAGDIVIIRRQPTVEEGEIAAVTVDGEGTLKRWQVREKAVGSNRSITVRLSPANARFAPLEIDAGHHQEVRVFGKYLGLIRRC